MFLSETSAPTFETSLYLAPSPIHGMGVFSGEHMPQGTVLGIAHQPQGEQGRLAPTTDLGRYHNHSSQPNCESVLNGGERHLVALVDIMPHEEITVDYTKQPELEQPSEDWMLVKQVEEDEDLPL